jgi:hypothetical protein
MSSPRFGTPAKIIIATALPLALVACGPASSGSGTLQSISTPTSSATSAPSAPSPSAAPPASVAATTTLTLSVTPDPAGSTVLAVLSTSTGVPATGTVTFSVDGTPLGTAAVANGQASIVIPAGLPVGDHSASATFAPDNAATVTAASATAAFAAAKAGSAVSASVGKDAIRYGDQETFEITVQAPGAPAGTDLTGHITVTDGAEIVAEGDTDPAGNAALSVYNTADPGSKTYLVSYSGGAAVEASTSQFTVQTTQTNVDIAISWTDNLLPGGDAVITADIIGTPQSPSGNATISYDGNQIAGGAIDDNGKLSGTASAVTAGDHQIKVSYAGDIRFEPNTSSATLTVKEPVANPNAAGAAAAQASNPCPAAAAACVDLSNEQAWLQSGGQITYGPVPITSGAAGSRTRTGTFSVFWLDKNHKSSLFNNAPMPNSVFFDGDIAFHQGSLYDQSNGCIHLSWDASETFFNTLSVGKKVYVWGAAPY